LVQATADCLVAGSAVALGTWLRYGYELPEDSVRGLAIMVPLAMVLQAGMGMVFGLYQRRWSYGSFEEVAALAQCVVLNVTLLIAATVLFVDRDVSGGAVLIAAPFELVGMAAARYLWRLRDERRRRPDPSVAEPLLVFGAGGGGRQTIDALLGNPSSPWFPAGLLDDDPAQANLTLRGVKTLGDRTDIGAAADATGATAIILAIPSASSELIRELSALATDAQLRVLALPPAHDLLGSSVEVDDIRPLTEADLLCRRELDTDVEAIAGYLSGRRVLVTGAGGSIGSELCRQIHRYSPAALMMLDRDESALHAVQLSIEGQAMLDDRNLIVADIRDRTRVSQVFAEHRPEVVFHAAALKHLPLLEMHPCEAVQTNIWGTEHLLEPALAHDVDRFVNISTDKAADPGSVLGYTKRIAERLTAAAVHETDRPFVSVRFANVLGSRGSVLTAFRRQIEAGGPVTVTHPEVTRYFMTVEEAVQLVIQAGAVGRRGEVLVLDMGVPVRIEDMARQLIERDGGDIDIVHTGLRPGEKLHEQLFASHEDGARPDHPLISHVPVDPLGANEVARAVAGVAPDAIGACLREISAMTSLRAPADGGAGPDPAEVGAGG
jgi:FlaA1/EpsC-like NDP-sugar epimerase